MFRSTENGESVQLSARVAFLTDVGRKRQNNEDSCIVYPLDGTQPPSGGQEYNLALGKPGLLLAVADGMGGHFAGEVASRLGVENLVQQLLQQIQDTSGENSDPQAMLRQAIDATHRVVYSHSLSMNEGLTMGTTLTGVWLVEARAAIAQVGDSRAYLFREGNLILLTRDQTIGCLLRSHGEESMMITEEAKEMLTQAVGAQPDIDVVTCAVDLQSGDWLLLCSDGLYKTVSPEDLVDCLEAVGDAAAKTANLISRANKNGGPDNITAILAEINAV